MPESIIEKSVTLLPVRDEPKSDESLDGFLARIGELNRFDLIGTWMSSYLGMKIGDGPYDAAAIQRASIATGVNVERLQQMQSHHLVLGNASDRQPEDKNNRAMVYHARRACPSCLRDHGYQKAALEFRFVRYCPEHQVELLDACPGCNKQLTWTTPFLHRCSLACEYDLRAFQPVPVSENDTLGQTYLLNRLTGVVQEEPDLLRGLSNSEAYYLMRHFGYFGHISRTGLSDDPFGHIVSSMRLDGDDSLRNERSANPYTGRFLTAGFLALSEPPDVFEQGVALAMRRAEKRAIYVVQTVRRDAIGWSHRPMLLDILDRVTAHVPPESRHLLTVSGSQGNLRERLEKAKALIGRIW